MSRVRMVAVAAVVAGVLTANVPVAGASVLHTRSVLALVGSWHTLSPPSSTGNARVARVGFGPTQSGDGYVYAYDAETKSFVSVPISAAGKSAPESSYRYAVSPECPQARPLDAVDCTTADEYCARNGATGVHEDVWRKQLEPIELDWAVVGNVCSGNQRAPIPIRAVGTGASEYERDHMPLALPLIQPGAIALVNLPILVSVQQAGEQIMQVEQPVPGRLVATPTYSWLFNDGATASGPGVAYDGTDPRLDPTHYLAHTYAAMDANASVTLTVTWTATFTAAGVTIPLPALVMPAQIQEFTVQESRSVLVSN